MLYHYPLFFHKHHQPSRVVVIFKLRDWELVSRDDNGHHTRILPFDWEIPTPSLPIIAAFVWEISRCDFYHFFGELFHSTLFPEFRDFTNVEFVIFYQYSLRHETLKFVTFYETFFQTNTGKDCHRGVGKMRRWCKNWGSDNKIIWDEYITGHQQSSDV